MKINSEINRYLTTGACLGVVTSYGMSGFISENSLFLENGPRRPTVARPQLSSTISRSALDLEAKLKMLTQMWREVESQVAVTEPNGHTDLEILMVEPDEIGFVSPEHTIKMRLRVAGFHQGQPESLPLDDIDFEIFEI